jgi:hypothetical protein
MERVASRRGLISARTEEKRVVAAREIQICQLVHPHAIWGENGLLRGIFEAERK